MRVIELRDEGLDAVVVVDHDLFAISAGGTRMLPDVDVREVARLARAMTWKFAVYGIPYAGAKAGVRFKGGDRDALVAAYRRALEPYADVFRTGPDMGTSPEDFVDATDGPLPLWAQTHEGLGMDDLATGHGVKAAAEAALVHAGRELAGATVAIEGFGKVGAGAARAFARGGATVVGVSTVAGLIVDPDGLDVERMIALRASHGDGFVEHAGLELRRREELFGLDCDVLVPGARPDSITREVACDARCVVIAPAANAPYGAGALEVLDARGIVAVPDFIANGGGVQLYVGVQQDTAPPVALAAIEATLREITARTLGVAHERAITPVAAALSEGRRYLERAAGASPGLLDQLVAS